MLVFRERDNWNIRRKTSRSKYGINNKLNPPMSPSPGIEPGPHWWEASALTTAPSLLPFANHRYPYDHSHSGILVKEPIPAIPLAVPRSKNFWKLTDGWRKTKETKRFKQLRTANQKLTNKENLDRFLHRGKPIPLVSCYSPRNLSKNVDMIVICFLEVFKWEG